MTHNANTLELSVSAQGRVVIPAPLRRAMGIGAGDFLLAHIEDDRLVLEKAETIKRRLKARFAKIDKTTSLADELIFERKEESKRELTK